MSPTPVDSSRKRKLSGNSETASTSDGGTPKKSKLTSAKDSIYKVFNWITSSTRKALSRDSLVQPITYVNKVWDELSQSFGQGYEYQGPELEGPELITSVPTIVPMSNVSLTASSGMPSTNLATNTTFINLAPQPSLPPFAASTNLHSGNTNLNHPLQSLHAMHPGGGGGGGAGGGEILSSDMGNPDATVAALVAAQMSLNRSHVTNETGKYSRSSNGFAPTGFSTPVMSVAAPQSRLSNRSGFSFGMGASQNVASFSSQMKGKAQERTPLRIKKTPSANKSSTHDKIFSNRPVTTLRPPRPDSPSVPHVFRHLLRKVRRKPYAVEHAINLAEKKTYMNLLLSNGVRLNNGNSQGSTSSQEPRGSRASSVVTLGSRLSDSSHSPPIASLPIDVSWKPVTPTGSALKPIRLSDGDEDDEKDDPEVIAHIPSPKPAPKEIVIGDDEDSAASKTASASDGDAASAPVSNGVAEEVVLDGDSTPEVEESPPIKATSKGKTPSTSSGKSAFMVEKEIPGAKTVDLTGETEIVNSTFSQFVEKPTVRKISVPSEPAFMKSMRQSPYTDPKWLAGMKHAVVVDKNKNDICAKEQEAHLQVLRSEQESQDRDLVDRIQNTLTLTRRIKPPVEEVFVESSEEESEAEEEEEEDKDFPPLSDEMEDKVNEATNPNPPMDVLSSAFKLDITRKDIRTLVGLEWLNDEIINFYMNMLVDRSEKSEGALPKAYTFNTFFYPTLIKDGYARLKRWTRRVDLFAHDIIIIPVHLQMHWCLAIIDFERKEIRYYDSMGGNNQKCLNALRTYLEEEHKDKKKSSFDFDGWNFECVKDIPQQMNGSDCGMFTCKFAEYVTRRADINFTQEHMPYFRRRMIYEILTLQLM